MSRYINYLLITASKKKGFYIITLLFFLAAGGLLYLGINSSSPESHAILRMGTFQKWMPFVFSTIFVALSVVHIFKSGEKDGSELLISAKPIARKSIIFGKFISLFILILIFNVISFLFYLAISNIDSYATTLEKVKFALTFTLGGLIINALSAFIIVIIASFIGRVGVIIISILYASAFPILSFSLIPSTNAIDPVATSRSGFSGSFFIQNVISDNDTTDPEKIYSEFPQAIVINEPLDITNSDIKNNINSSYNSAKYFDLWYQWGRFYDLIQKPTSLGGGFGYVSNHITPKLTTKFSTLIAKTPYINSQSEKLYFTFNNKNDASIVEAFSKYDITYDKAALIKLMNLPTPTKAVVDDKTDISNYMNQFDNEFNFKVNKPMEGRDPLLSIRESMEYFKFLLISKWSSNNKDFFTKDVVDKIWSSVTSLDTGDSNNDLKTELEVYNILTSSKATSESEIDVDKGIYKYESSEYLDTTTVTIAWVIIALLLGVASVYVYLRRDFK